MHVLLAEADLSSMLFENPWPAVIALLGVSSVLRVIGKRRNEKRLVVASYAALTLGLGVYVTAALVNTDREQLIGRTEAFAAATYPVDETALRGLIADKAVLLGPEGQLWDDLDADFVAEKLKQFEVEVLDVRDIAADPTRPGYGISTMRVSHEVLGQRVPGTDWEIAWQQDTEGPSRGRWRISSMKWLKFGLNEPHRGLYQ